MIALSTYHSVGDMRWNILQLVLSSLVTWTRPLLYWDNVVCDGLCFGKRTRTCTKEVDALVLMIGLKSGVRIVHSTMLLKPLQSKHTWDTIQGTFEGRR